MKENKFYIKKQTKTKTELAVFLIVSGVIFIVLTILLMISPSEGSELYPYWADVHLIVSVLFIFLLTYFIIALLKLIQRMMEERNKMLTYVGQSIETIDKFSGEEFEEFLCFYFKRLGYRVRLTQQTRDYGADLFLERNGEKIIVQAKRYSTKVPIKAIQEIVAAKAYYHANKALVVTNSTYTKSAIDLAEANDVELWDRFELKKRFSL